MDTQINTTDTETKTKESSVIDFTYLSLEELESQVVSLFPDEEEPEGHFHYFLFCALLYRMVCEGYSKTQLFNVVDSEYNAAIEDIIEWDDPDADKEFHDQFKSFHI